MIQLTKEPLNEAERMQLAQQAYHEYMGKCFWRLNESLVITKENLPQLLNCLELYGGHQG